MDQSFEWRPDYFMNHTILKAIDECLPIYSKKDMIQYAGLCRSKSRLKLLIVFNLWQQQRNK